MSAIDTRRARSSADSEGGQDIVFSQSLD